MVSATLTSVIRPSPLRTLNALSSLSLKLSNMVVENGIRNYGKRGQVRGAGCTGRVAGEKSGVWSPKFEVGSKNSELRTSNFGLRFGSEDLLNKMDTSVRRARQSNRPIYSRS